MSHGGHHGHSGHHHGHHTGHHHGSGLGGHVLDASLCLDFLQGIFVSLFPKLKRSSSGKGRQAASGGPQSADLSSQGREWESSLQPPKLSDKLMHIDLRPFFFLVLFLTVLFLYAALISWLRYNDDHTGKTYGKIKTKAALLGLNSDCSSGVPAGVDAPASGSPQWAWQNSYRLPPRHRTVVDR